MTNLPNLQIHINGQSTFFLDQKTLSTYSRTIRKLIKQERKATQSNKLSISLDDFPGGGSGFELVSRFIYNNAQISITVSNIPILYCSAIYLRMNRANCDSNSSLLHQSENFLETMFEWSWNDVINCLHSCEPFFRYADSCGLIDRLVTTLLAKIAQNTDISLICSPSSSSYSSPEQQQHSASSGQSKAWWFDDLSVLSPLIIEKVIRSLGCYGSDNTSQLLSRFLLHYLNTAPKLKRYVQSSSDKQGYTGLADTAVYGVIFLGKSAFSCRALFWVLRLVSGFSLSPVCQAGLERLIGSVLDTAKLDDLLVSGHASMVKNGDVYDVNLVIRLIRVFVECEGVSINRVKKVGKLIDQYLAEISPDHNLKVGKFIGVAQSLPDLARDCFDGVYRAIDIYLESHPNLSFEERTRLCRCLNYEKLSLEACKELAKNPRIPPRVAVQALASQKHVTYTESPSKTTQLDYYHCSYSPTKTHTEARNQQILVCGKHSSADAEEGLARSPRVPPRAVAGQPLRSQRNVNCIDFPTKANQLEYYYECHNAKNKYYCDTSPTAKQIVVYGKHVVDDSADAEAASASAEEEDYEQTAGEGTSSLSEGSEDLRLNIQRMQWRVMELEKLCKEMKGQMSRLVRHSKSNCNSPAYNKPPRLC